MHDVITRTTKLPPDSFSNIHLSKIVKSEKNNFVFIFFKTLNSDTKYRGAVHTLTTHYSAAHTLQSNITLTMFGLRVRPHHRHAAHTSLPHNTHITLIAAGQPLNVIFRFLSVRCIRRPGFALIRVVDIVISNFHPCGLGD